MPTTIAAADEACEALVTRINAAGSGYTLSPAAEYSYEEIDPLEQVSGTRVDVVPNLQRGQSVRLDGLDASIHEIRVWIRKQCPDLAPTTIKPLTLLRQQIMEWLDNWDSSNKRVRVWDSENEDLEQPVKEQLRLNNLFVACIVLEVHVEP